MMNFTGGTSRDVHENVWMPPRLDAVLGSRCGAVALKQNKLLVRRYCNEVIQKDTSLV